MAERTCFTFVETLCAVRKLQPLPLSFSPADQTKEIQLANLRGSLGAIEVFGFSLSIIALTSAMAFAITLTVQSAGRAAPLVCLIGGTIVTLVALSFVAFDGRVVHARSAYAYVDSVPGPRCGFVAGWALPLMWARRLADSTALVGNFGAAVTSALTCAIGFLSRPCGGLARAGCAVGPLSLLCGAT